MFWSYSKWCKLNRLEQRSVIKFLMAEKCKQWEIHSTMCDVYGEVCFNEKKKRAKNSFATMRLSQKTVYGAEVCQLSGKEKVAGAAVSREGHADSLLKHKSYQYWLSLKSALLSSDSYCKLLKQNWPYLLNDHHIYIYIYMYIKSWQRLSRVTWWLPFQ